MGVREHLNAGVLLLYTRSATCHDDPPWQSGVLSDHRSTLVVMKNERLRVVDLAGELGVSARALVMTAHELDINVIRGAALLHAGQVHKLRQYYKNNRDARRRPTPAIDLAKVPKKHEEEARGARCTCCDFTFTYLPFKDSHDLCPECRDHFPRDGEAGWQAQVRLEDHAAQARRKANDYREACAKLSKERDEAYEKRNKWMAALVEIVVAHGPDDEGDGCMCGSPEFPCLTRRHLRDVNRGIYNRCEELEGMNEDEFNKVLYGIDFAFFKDWDDGVA